MSSPNSDNVLTNPHTGQPETQAERYERERKEALEKQQDATTKDKNR